MAVVTVNISTSKSPPSSQDSSMADDLLLLHPMDRPSAVLVSQPIVGREIIQLGLGQLGKL